jgi:hypothetical protein
MAEKGRRRLRDGRELPVHANRGLRKICDCPRRTWSKCLHAWHFSYRWKGRHSRFSLSTRTTAAVKSRSEAEAADKIRIGIREGTFEQRTRETPQPAGTSGLSFETYGQLFLAGYGRDRGKDSLADDRYLVRRLMAFETACRRLGDVPIRDVAENDVEEFVRRLVDARRSRRGTTTSSWSRR